MPARTSQLHQIFRERRQLNAPSGPYVSSKAPSPQILEVVSTLTLTVRRAIERAQTILCRAAQLLDLSPPSLSGTATASALEDELRVCEVELRTAADGVVGTLEVIRTDHQTKQSQLLMHVEHILAEERSAIASIRVQLVLCREELRAFKARKQKFASYGATPLEREDLLFLARLQSLGDDAEKKVTMGSTRDLEEADHREDQMKLRLVSGSRDILESVWSGLSHSLQDDTLVNQFKKVLQPPIEGVAPQHSLIASPFHTSSPTVASEPSAAEATSLRQEHDALMVRQHEELAEEAIEVEGAVRDLAQLNSLINEAVLTQREKFSILVKNTEEAQVTFRKAVSELEKPVEAFWNSSRQLMVLLWCCIVVLLAANWLMR